MKVVLDTNVLLVAISPRSADYWLFEALLQGDLTLCVTTDILDEYAEIIEQQMNAEIAEMTLDLLLTLPNTLLIHKHYFWQLVEQDPDDNKFIDCAIAAQAQYLVSNDKHLNILKKYDYFRVTLLLLAAFQEYFLQENKKD
jgi:putative PIN family toxin of toxin-antitoxin system